MFVKIYDTMKKKSFCVRIYISEHNTHDYTVKLELKVYFLNIFLNKSVNNF